MKKAISLATDGFLILAEWTTKKGTSQAFSSILIGSRKPMKINGLRDYSRRKPLSTNTFRLNEICRNNCGITYFNTYFGSQSATPLQNAGYACRWPWALSASHITHLQVMDLQVHEEQESSNHGFGPSGYGGPGHRPPARRRSAPPAL